ncbi:hypothetical protein CENSYa_0527 [Cenarchaeum symbiosum A]|uniref:Uncharacterized protein n=1 Tax=Cenarchaeum symbiosum (strain A) TaxID=414004 RepID=A0RUZ3_CENSY|nr:hypothetical protein CENSYa_0527 [Cenarchaeum symbiosum A]
MAWGHALLFPRCGRHCKPGMRPLVKSDTGGDFFLCMIQPGSIGAKQVGRLWGRSALEPIGRLHGPPLMTEMVFI